jgi:hypothetical protein
MCAHAINLPLLGSEWGLPEKSDPPPWPPAGVAFCRERITADVWLRRLPDEIEKLQAELADASSLNWQNKAELEQQLEKTQNLELLEEEFRRAHDPPADVVVLNGAAETFAAVQYYLKVLRPTADVRFRSFLLDLASAQRSAAAAVELVSELRVAKALQNDAASGAPLTVCTGLRVHRLTARLADRVDPLGEIEEEGIPSISFTPLGCLRIVPDGARGFRKWCPECEERTSWLKSTHVERVVKAWRGDGGYDTLIDGRAAYVFIRQCKRCERSFRTTVGQRRVCHTCRPSR